MSFIRVLLLWFPFCWGMIFLHELAHFVVGRMVGMAPFALVVGNGPVLFKRVGGAAAIYLRLNPSHGMVVTNPTGAESKWQATLFYGAGLAMDTALLSLFWALIFSRTLTGEAGRVLAMLAGGYTAIFLMNLVPRQAKIAGGLLPTDGRRVLDVMRGAKQEHRKDAIEAFAKSVRRYDPDFAAEKSWVANADAPLLRQYQDGAVAYLGGDLPRLLALYGDLLQRVPMSPGEEVMLLDAMASRVLFAGDETWLPQALDWARRGRQLLPDSLTMQGTVGACMVECGVLAMASKDLDARETATANVRAGLELLLPLTAEGMPESDQVISARYLAKGYLALGERKAASHWEERSLHNQPLAAPWANQRVGVIGRLGAAFIAFLTLTSSYVGIAALLRGNESPGPEVPFWLLLPLILYAGLHTLRIAVRGRAPGGWMPWS